MIFTNIGLHVSYRLVNITLECQKKFQKAMKPVFLSGFMKASLSKTLIISEYSIYFLKINCITDEEVHTTISPYLY